MMNSFLIFRQIGRVLLLCLCFCKCANAIIRIWSESNDHVNGIYVRGVLPGYENFYAKAASDEDMGAPQLWLYYIDQGVGGYRWYVGDDVTGNSALTFMDTYTKDVCQTIHATNTTRPNPEWMFFNDVEWLSDSTFQMECQGYEAGGIEACDQGGSIPCVELLGNGRTEVKMPLLMLGTAYISDKHGAGRDNPEVVEAPPAIELALDMDYQGLDLGSELHPAYANEKLTGDLLAQQPGRRKSVFITTKLSPNEHGYHSTLRAVQRSLQLLRTDTIDLFLIHHPSCLMVEQCEGDWRETWRAMERLLDLGAFRAIGVSNFDYSLLHHLVGDGDYEGMARVPVSLIQNRADPLALEDPNLLQLCERHNIQYQAFSVLGRQWVVGPWTDYWQAPHPILENPAVVAIANRLSQEGSSKRRSDVTVTPAQVVLRWALQKGWAVVPKTANEDRLESNRRLFNLELSEGDMIVMDHLQAPPNEAQREL